MSPDHVRTDLTTLAAVIAHSQIVISWADAILADLPEGYGDTEVAVLEWIAAEGRRRARHSYM
jgi:hypothetical protein